MAKNNVKKPSVSLGVLIAEFIGTMSLAAVVLASINGSLAAGVATPVLAALTLGVAVLAIGGISGAHINPGVTFGLLSAGKIKVEDAVGYWVAQVLGALAALGVMEMILDGGVAQVASSTSTWPIFSAEVLGMAFFTFGIAAAVHNKMSGANAALLVGGSLLVGLTLAAVISNGVLNPAVALAIGSVSPAYIFGPLVGAVIGNYAFRFMNDADK